MNTKNPYPSIFDVDKDKLCLLAEQKNKFHVVCMESRLGADLFITKAEHEVYPPRTSRNQLFELRILKWPDDIGIYWQIGSFQIEDFDAINAIADDCGLVLKKDTVPVAIGDEVDSSFPLSGDNVYMAENKKDSIVYTNNQQEISKVKAKFREEVRQIFVNDREKYTQELRNKGFNEEQVQKEVKMAWGES